MSEPGQRRSTGKDSLPAEQPVMEPARREEMALHWPNMEESRGILADYVSQFDVPPGSGTELPDDPDPGAED